jgi:hypothetical protein
MNSLKQKLLYQKTSPFSREKPVIFLMKLLLLDPGVSWEYLENVGGDCSLEKCRIIKRTLHLRLDVT